jgi:hypothetical protein
MFLGKEVFGFWFLVLWFMVYFNAGVFHSLIQDHLVGC